MLTLTRPGVAVSVPDVHLSVVVEGFDAVVGLGSVDESSGGEDPDEAEVSGTTEVDASKMEESEGAVSASEGTLVGAMTESDCCDGPSATCAHVTVLASTTARDVIRESLMAEIAWFPTVALKRRG